MTRNATATVKREISTSIALTREDLLVAIDSYVKGFDAPLTWEDIDWDIIGGELNGCKIEIVTVDNGEVVAEEYTP